MRRIVWFTFSLLLVASFVFAYAEEELKWTEFKVKHLDAHSVVAMFGGPATRRGALSASVTLSGPPKPEWFVAKSPRFPPGIENVVAIANDRKVLVRGTDQGIKQFAEIMALLDKPVRKVKVEYWLLQAQAQGKIEDIFGAFVKPQMAREDGDLVAGQIRGTAKAALAELEKRKVARVLSTGETQQFSNAPLPLASVATARHGGGGVGHQLICTVNSDASITLSIGGASPRDVATPVVGRIEALAMVVRSGTALALVAPGLVREDELFMVIRLTVLK